MSYLQMNVVSLHVSQPASQGKIGTDEPVDCRSHKGLQPQGYAEGGGEGKGGRLKMGQEPSMWSSFEGHCMDSHQNLL